MVNERTYMFVERCFSEMLRLLLFVLPWPTIWIVHQAYIHGSVWQYGTRGFFVTEGFFWVCAGLFMLRYAFAWRIKHDQQSWYWSRDRIYIFANLVFFVYVFCSQWWSVNTPVASFQSLHILEAILLCIIIYHAPGAWTRYIQAFVAGGVVQSILGIWQAVSQSSVSFVPLGLVSHPAWQAGTAIIDGDRGARWLRSYGAFSHPNVFGGFLVISLMGTAYLWNQEKRIRYRAVYHGMFLVQCAALFFTYSRTAWLAAIIGVLWIVVYASIQKKMQVLRLCFSSAILVGILAWIYAPLLHTRITYRAPHEKQSIHERVEGYAEALSLWQERPWFGTGIGNYTAALYRKNPTLPGWEYQPVHNVFLLFFVELGVVGGVLFLGVILSFFWYVSVLAKSMSGFFWCMVAAALIFGTMLLFDHYFFSSYVGLLLGAIFWAFAARICQKDGV